jgi:hypothetical protein
MSLDLDFSYKKASEKIQSLKTFKEVSEAAKSLENANQKIPFDQFNTNFKSPLENLKNAKKRFQRQVPSQLKNLLSLFQENAGSGSATTGFIKRRFLEAYTRSEPKIRQIVQGEMFTAVGCAQEQKYNPSSSIFVPVSSIDLFGKLKQDPETGLGKLFYEKPDPVYNEFPFSMNKELYQRMQSPGQTFETQFGGNYLGGSEQELFNISYVKQNDRGVTGDFFKVDLKNRQSTNNVGEFLSDYFATIKMVDTSDLMAEIVNLVTNSVDMKASLGLGELQQKKKFEAIMQRVLGLCFDSRQSIDVSGVAKVAELDGVDESFFQLTDVESAIIDSEISNIQMRSLEFVECEGVRVDVDYNNIVNQMVESIDNLDLDNPDVLAEQITKIIDSASDNPSWRLKIPNDFNIKLAIDTDLLQKLPLALVTSFLSPKVLLPIMVMLYAIGKEYADEIDSIQKFMEKFKNFFINVVSKAASIFIQELFELIKRDILLLVQSIAQDVQKSKILKKYAIIAKLVELATIIAPAIDDYRKCKSLIDDILRLLNFIGRNLGISVPYPLLLLSGLLGGTTPEDNTINVIEQMQKFGLPTGPLPDGSPNLNLISEFARQKGQELAEAGSGFVNVAVPPDIILPSGRPSQLTLSGKKF